jgi:hypothetical protein
MSTPAASVQQPVRLAAYHSVCVGCHRGIQPGDVITKPPGRAWQHDDCDKPRGGHK